MRGYKWTHCAIVMGNDIRVTCVVVVCVAAIWLLLLQLSMLCASLFFVLLLLCCACCCCCGRWLFVCLCFFVGLVILVVPVYVYCIGVDMCTVIR